MFFFFSDPLFPVSLFCYIFGIRSRPCPIFFRVGFSFRCSVFLVVIGPLFLFLDRSFCGFSRNLPSSIAEPRGEHLMLFRLLSDSAGNGSANMPAPVFFCVRFRFKSTRVLISSCPRDSPPPFLSGSPPPRFPWAHVPLLDRRGF